MFKQRNYRNIYMVDILNICKKTSFFASYGQIVDWLQLSENHCACIFEIHQKYYVKFYMLNDDIVECIKEIEFNKKIHLIKNTKLNF